MGVDCKIYLPSNVHVMDVTDVMGVAAGLPSERVDLNHNKAWYHRVIGASCKNSSVTTLVDIQLEGRMIDDEWQHNVNYHLECKRGRLLMPRSTAFWIAIGRRLVDFFGGHMDYQNCDDVYDDYIKLPKPNRLNCPEDGIPWQKFQERMEAVKPITLNDLKMCKQWAAYTSPLRSDPKR